MPLRPLASGARCRSVILPATATRCSTRAFPILLRAVLRFITRCRPALRSDSPGGLSFLASYTWSHSIDNASSANLGSSNNSGPRFFRAFPEWERGNSDFDVRHRFVFSYIYDLPFGHGKRFGGDLTGAPDKILGGWQIAGITTLSTGQLVHDHRWQWQLLQF